LDSAAQVQHQVKLEQCVLETPSHLLNVVELRVIELVTTEDVLASAFELFARSPQRVAQVGGQKRLIPYGIIIRNSPESRSDVEFGRVKESFLDGEFQAVVTLPTGSVDRWRSAGRRRRTGA